ncbi:MULTISPECIES: extracellular solute-binding protein [unclassified Devosia]|uniref:ABC transporter substrate-binding protein n=1 Tax=unclassified Devosia TaxID=196773 RepID=UPI001AC5E943|nr:MULTISPECIES: extracellular solute-binding protein [unclassified Devosia]MBN9306693.1 extracellular solute-binding protein [Devosia sp.]
MHEVRRLTLAATAFLALSAGSALAQEVSFMGWVGLFDFQKKGWDNIVSSFEKSHPGMTVKYIGTPNEQTLNQAVVAINGGQSPDIVQVNPGWVSQLNGMSALTNLSDKLPKTTLDNIPQGYRDAMTFDGSLVAVPWIPGPIAMVYNRTLMKEAGLDPDHPPQTWQEFTSAVDAICALGDKNGGKVYGVALRTAQQPASGLWTLPIIWAQGGDVVDAGGKVNFDTDATKSTLTWLHDVIGKGCAPEFADIQQSRNLFAQGRAGFIFEGPWIGGIVANISGGALKVGKDADVWMANMPASDGKSPRDLDNSNMLVLTKKGADNPAAAAFVDFIISDPQAVEYFYETSNQLTTGRTDLIGAGKMGQDPYVQAFAAILKNANPLPIRDVQATGMYDALSKAMQAVIKGADVAGEIATLDSAVERLAD